MAKTTLNRREQRVQEIFLIGKENKLNLSTLTFLVAMTNDKALGKLHKELFEKYPNTNLDILK